jgi:hypothetical protein
MDIMAIEGRVGYFLRSQRTATTTGSGKELIL